MVRTTIVLLALGVGGVAASCALGFDDFTYENAPVVASASGASSTSSTGGAPATSSSNAGGAQSSSASTAAMGGAGGAGGAGGMGGAGGIGGMGGIGGGMAGAGGVGGMDPCGNGTLDPGEGCDDANAVSQDGCSNVCMVEGQADICPTGADITLAPPGIWISDTTVNKNAGNNTTCGGGSAGDMVYRFTPTQTGMLTIVLTGAYNKVLAVRDACMQGGVEAFCNSGTGTLMTTYAAMQNQPFHVVVSGPGGAEGAFILHVFY